MFREFFDGLSFEQGEHSYKALKSLLEGGIETKPDNVIFYATSNRRHLIAREIVENEKNTAIHESEVVEEKIPSMRNNDSEQCREISKTRPYSVQIWVEVELVAQ